MEQVPFVSVVVPTRNRSTLLAKCLESLFAQKYPSDHWEIVVVEDGSSEGGAAVESCRSKSPVPVEYVRIQHSGVATARNVGLERARGGIVAYIDDDALAVPEWLSTVVESLSRDGVGGVGGRVSSDYAETSLHATLSATGDLIWTGSNCEIPEPQDVEFIPGGNMAFHRQVLATAGAFDPHYSKRGVWREETDACVRVRRRGHRLLFNSRMKIYHRAARWLHPLERVKPIVVWFMVRDDAYFRAKNFGWAGVRGAVASQISQAGTRLALAAVNFALVFVHLLAWIPGALQGLRRQPAKVQAANS
jgi:glycosyltransferase involved in cell wall biosynthesis